jgi:putative hemolysin
MDIFFSILFTILLIFCNGYFAMSELALISARRVVLQQIIEQEQPEQGKQASKALELTANSDRLLATIQVAITLLSLGASVVAATALSDPINAWLTSFEISWLSVIARPISVFVITLLISYFSLVAGELVPKRIALANPERTAMRVAGPVAFFARITRPAVALLSVSTNLVARLFGIKDTQDRQVVSEEEIKYLVTEQESLLDDEKRMIHEIFDLGDTVAREVMVPRVDMIYIEDDATVGSTINRMRGTGFSRLPVIRENPDRVIGVVMLKDLLAPLVDNRYEEPISEYLREAMFVPETKDILPLLSEMQISHQQLVIVVDEYGGTAGLISIEDIVEEIVGDISDEFDPDNKYLTQLSDDEWLIDGRLPTDDARELGLPVTEDDDYETIAGWLMDTIDSVPQVGDSFEIGDYNFKVQTMRRNRIALLRVTKSLADNEQFSLPD